MGTYDNQFHENETWADGTEESIWQSQHQDVKISNWEAALDYSLQALPWLRFEAGYKGNYNHENSPASCAGGPDENGLLPLDELYKRFKYDTDILRTNNDMISHVSFLAPMASDPNVNTMYYGHANVGNMVNSGVEIKSRNSLFGRLTLTTTLNLYNSHLKAWSADYPLHDSFYAVHGDKQNRLVWDVRCMASVRLPWNMTFQAEKSIIRKDKKEGGS